MPRFKVASPIRHNGELYGVGDPIEVSKDEAEQLGLSGSIEAPAKKESQPTVKEVVAQIKACETLKAVDIIIGDDTRDGVLKAAEAKRIELTPPGE